MDDELIDPMEHSMDEIRHNFENYKMRHARLLRADETQEARIQLDKELQDLRAEMQELRLEMSTLHTRQSELLCWHDDNAIEELPSSICELDLMHKEQTDNIVPSQQPMELTGCQQKDELQPDQDQLVINCESSPCLFDYCHMHVDSHLLLLHYFSDHNEETSASQRCHKVCKGQRVILSFDSRCCKFKQNHVIGLLAYIGPWMAEKQQQQKPLDLWKSAGDIYDSFLPQEQAHLASNVPIVVLICLTASKAALQDKPLAHRTLPPTNAENQVFVIWLATTQDLQVQLRASLKLCGRDAAIQAKAQVAVCQVKICGDAGRFMPVDTNYWRLSFSEIQKISNDFRDELHLEIDLTHLSPNWSPIC
ncbi:uncharacterized protein LOC6579397 [Drosophila mojavensis]|uniref:DUF4729 domain-containing protein n=1 Tax=Drosophila mojavensis TaxID=7230 RepID=B4KQA0_DROMO|nr:uncharacterized protein LOC6579397 [Drosophila mojavensis]EDW09228.1 uncharacterized protein Dmoj_GI19160 [Drosophila mojavensis]